MKLSRSAFVAALVGLSVAGSGLIDPVTASGLTLKKRSTTKTATAKVGNLGSAFHPSCASGFSMAGSNKQNGWTDWFVCSTPVITCPKQLQTNGKYSAVTPKVVIQHVGGDPDSSTAKFRVQYQCDYSPTAVPVP